jgi:hypothetical protein
MSEPTTLSEEPTSKMEDEQLDVAPEEDNQDEVQNSLKGSRSKALPGFCSPFFRRARKLGDEYRN